MRSMFIHALVTAGVPHMGTIRTHYCRDDFGCVIPGCQGHCEARVHSDHIDIARNVCATLNGDSDKDVCRSATVYM